MSPATATEVEGILDHREQRTEVRVEAYRVTDWYRNIYVLFGIMARFASVLLKFLVQGFDGGVGVVAMSVD